MDRWVDTKTEEWTHRWMGRSVDGFSDSGMPGWENAVGSVDRAPQVERVVSGKVLRQERQALSSNGKEPGEQSGPDFRVCLESSSLRPDHISEFIA